MGRHDVPDWVWAHPAQRASKRRAAWRARQFALDDECPCCGAIMHDGGEDDDTLCTVDHHVPLAAGGKDEPSNWRLMCKGCNQAKGDAVPSGDEWALRPAARPRWSARRVPTR